VLYTPIIQPIFSTDLLFYGHNFYDYIYFITKLTIILDYLDRLDLRKIPRFQGTSGLVPMVLSDRDVSVDTSREEKQLAVDQIWSGDGGALRKSSIVVPFATLSFICVIWFLVC